MEQITFFLSDVFVKYFHTSNIFQDMSLCELVEETLLPVINTIFNTILKRGKMHMRIMKRTNLRRDFGCSGDSNLRTFEGFVSPLIPTYGKLTNLAIAIKPK